MSSTILMGYSEKAHKFFTQQLVADGNRVYLNEGEIDSAQWANNYDHLVLLPFGDKNYVLCQSKSNFKVYINEILKDGTLSESTSDTSEWKTYYPNLFSYQLNGKVYLAGQSSGNKDFFIQEITPGGKFGQITYKVDWGDFYDTMGCCEVGYRVFMYAQSKESKKFFTRELGNGELLGDSVTPDKWDNYYPSMGSIKVGGKTYLYGQYDGNFSQKFFMQEVLPEGKLAENETYRKGWSNFYNCLGSLYLNNRSYIYGFSKGGGRFMIQEVLPGGILAENETFSQKWGNPYSSLLTLTSDKFVFNDKWMEDIYKRMPETSTLKDFCMPASHDAGIYKVELRTTYNILSKIPGISDGLEKVVFPKIETQSLDILGQLRRGVRYFDLRPGIATKITGDKEMYLMHDFVPGEKLSNAFDQIKNFMTDSKETVILYFSHFDIGKDNSNNFVKLLGDKLGDKLLKRGDIGTEKSINNLPMSKLQGQVIALVNKGKGDDAKFDYQTLENKNIYKALYFGEGEQTDADSVGNDVLFTVFDHYANATSFETMRNDQAIKFENFGKSGINKDALCAVDWTLTLDVYNLDLIKSFSLEDIDILPPGLKPDFKIRLAQFLKDNPDLLPWNNQEKANYINPKLLNPDKESEVFTQLNTHKRMVNFFSLDYVPKGIVEVCIQTMENCGKLLKKP